MSKEHEYLYTVIPAPTGMRGVFEITHGDFGDALEIDDVAFLTIWHHGLGEGCACTHTPAGYSLCGMRAVALIHPDGRVIADNGTYRNVAHFIRECALLPGSPNNHKPLLDPVTGKRVDPPAQ
ncbi:hypothetical protein [Ralstonia pseudosolanacearum]|uniref:hypothetical protein n=1 Tax=Ralstonia pseudosolanacearum TaxID=1310165 RepID=UPI003CEC9B78